MNKHPGLWSVAVLGCLFLPHVLSQRCEWLDQCRCETRDGSGIIDLNSLAVAAEEAPKWTLDGGDGWLYSYNPCAGFNSSQFTNLAVFQHSNNSGFEYELGSQSYEDFSYSLTQGLAITYMASDFLRQTNVYLVCTPSLTDHNLLFLGETIVTQYDFILESPCACAGLCDGNGIIDQTSSQGVTSTQITSTEPGQNTASTSTDESTTTTAPSTGSTIATDETTGPPSYTTSSGTTTDSNETDNCGCGNNNGLTYWNDVGADIVSLVLHDLILVVIIASVLLTMKFAFKKRLAFCVDNDDTGLRFKASTADGNGRTAEERADTVKTFSILPEEKADAAENVYANLD